MKGILNPHTGEKRALSSVTFIENVIKNWYHTTRLSEYAGVFYS